MKGATMSLHTLKPRPAHYHAKQARSLIIQAVQTVDHPIPQILGEAHAHLVQAITKEDSPERRTYLARAISRVGGALRLCGRDDSAADSEAMNGASEIFTAYPMKDV
jgi:hypothetical protein